MFFALALGVGLIAGGVLVFARWRGEVAVRREREAAGGRTRRHSLGQEIGKIEERAAVAPGASRST